MGKFVVTRELSRDRESGPMPPEEASLCLVLRSLQDPGHMARLDAFESEGAARATGGEVYEVLFQVTGPWDKMPSHAVYAVWEIRDRERAADFVESRRQLFALRQQVLPTFAADWLLKHRDHERRYMVVGFYGDEDGASRLCREHPVIKQFAAAHPASDYSAVDLTGLLCWRIESLGPVANAI
jgi:hypothetical protein